MKYERHKTLLRICLTACLLASLAGYAEEEYPSYVSPDIIDIRVDELVKSKWGQLLDSVWDNYGNNCYNYYTPDNLPCGCVATALAQLMRYHRYPAASKPITLECAVRSIPERRSIQNHTYNYDLMKLIPECDDQLAYWSGFPEYDWYDGGSTEEARKAIGTLTYDCGVAMRMDWGKFIRMIPATDAEGHIILDDNGKVVMTNDLQSASNGAFALDPLTNIFGYACAKSYIALTNNYQHGNIPEGELKQIILPNLDAGYPVMMGISMSANEFGHEIIVDGYGFVGNTLYLHLNMGWSGADNGWYTLPLLSAKFMEGFQSRIVQHVVYNIFPRASGEILSGRVLDPDGVPVANAFVEVLNSAGSVVTNTISSSKGIYAFILDGGRTYRIRVSEGAESWMSDNITLGVSVNPYALNFKTGDFRYSQMKCGNSWGNDIILSDSTHWKRTFMARFDGLPVTFSHDDVHGWTVVFYDDAILSNPISLPDDVGRVTLDMQGHAVRLQGSSAFPVTIVHSGDGSTTINPTRLRCIMSNRSFVLVSASIQAEQPDMGSITGGNVIVEPGTKVTLKATPASGCVFAGWYADGEPLDGPTDHRSASFSYEATEEPVVITATFVRSGNDYIQIDCTPAASYPPMEKMSLPVNVYSYSLPSVVVSGLPAGVTFDAATSTITGTPTTPGQIVEAKITAKNQTDNVGKIAYVVIKIGDATSRLLPDLRHNDIYAYPKFMPGQVPDMVAVLGQSTMDTLAEGGWTVSGLPNGMKFDSVKGVFSGAPVDPDRAYLVTFKKGNEIATVTFVTDSLPELRLSMHVYNEAGTKITDQSLLSSFSVKGAGTYLVGTTVSLTATCPKDYVFAGWYVGDEPVSNGSQDFRTASGFKFKMPMSTAESQAVVVTAKFWPLSKDEESLTVNVTADDVPAAGEDGSFSFDIGRCVSSFTVPKVTLSGLPKGLKFDSKKLMISGTATTPGIYKVKVSATNASVKKATSESSDEFTITIPNFTAEVFRGDGSTGLDTTGKYVLTAGAVPDLSDLFARIAAGNWKLSVSGLPSGVKYDSKKGVLTGIASKEGTYTVFFTATNGKEKQIATATFEVIFPELKLETGVWKDTSAGGTATGGGMYPMGKKITLKAAPAKGCIFLGWKDEDGECLSQNASYSYVTTDKDVTLIAVFATKAEDEGNLRVALEDVITERDGTIGTDGTFDLGARVTSLSLPKISVSGLPAGLKFDAKTMKITGKATKPGVYTVKVAATNTSVKKATTSSTGEFKLTVPNFTCDALPWLKPEVNAYGIIRCGVAINEDLVNCSLKDAAGWTVKVSGLPSGLKWDAQRGVITGVPTAKPGAYTVTFTVSKKGDKNQVATITFNVENLPNWAVGTFDGMVWNASTYGSDGTYVPPCGIISITVAANGKISGKLFESDKTWTLAAVSYDKKRSTSVAENDTAFFATVTGKCGKESFVREVEVKDEGIGRGIMNAIDSYSTSGTEGASVQVKWTAWQNLWKQEPWSSLSKVIAKAASLDLPVMSSEIAGVVTAADMVSLKFSASGAVAASGKFITGQDSRGKDVVYSAKCSTVLIPVIDWTSATGGTYGLSLSKDRYSLFLFFPSKAGKFDGYATEIRLYWTGTSFVQRD